jgi:hypothetical protein
MILQGPVSRLDRSDLKELAIFVMEANQPFSSPADSALRSRLAAECAQPTLEVQARRLLEGAPKMRL